MHGRGLLKTCIGCTFPAIAAACVLALGPGTVSAAPDAPGADRAASKPMDVDAPMAGGMKKEGMKVGDVKKAAEKWDRKMRKMIEKERQPAADVKK
jgi:hypothetical protein